MSTATAQPTTATTTWNIDPAHSAAEFKVKHMMISNVKGQFAKVTGTLTLDEFDLSRSRVEALIEASSRTLKVPTFSTWRSSLHSRSSQQRSAW